MAITYKTIAVDVEKMVENTAMTAFYRDILLHSRHSLILSGEYDFANEIEKDIMGILEIRQKINIGNKLTAEESMGLELENIIVDYDEPLLAKIDIFSKPAILEQFLNFCKNKRSEYMLKAQGRLAQKYEGIIGEIGDVADKIKEEVRP